MHFTGKKRIIALILIMASLNCLASSRFIAGDGNDKAVGTIEHPWSSIQFAIDNISAGDTLFIRGGIYRQMFNIHQTGTDEAWTVIQSYADEVVNIWWSVDMSAASNWISKGNNRWFTKDGSFNQSVNYDVATIWHDDQSHWSYKKASPTDLKKQWDFYHNKEAGRLEVYSVGNPATHAAHIEVPRSPPGPPYQFVTNLSGSYILLEGLHYKYINVHGIRLGGDSHHIVFRNGSISHGGGANINPYYNPPVRWGDCIDVTNGAHHIWFEHSEFGEYVDGTLTNQGNTGLQRYIYFRNNYIYSSTCGIHCWLGKPGGENRGVGLENIYYDGNTFVDIGKGWFEGRAVMVGGIQVIPRENVEVKDFYISDNLFLNCGDTTHKGNTWRGVNAAINIGGGDIVLSNNHIIGGSAEGIHIRAVHQKYSGKVIDNTIVNTAWSGIHIQENSYTEAVEVAGNAVWNCGDSVRPELLIGDLANIPGDSKTQFRKLQNRGYTHSTIGYGPKRSKRLKLEILEGTNEEGSYKLICSGFMRQDMPVLRVFDMQHQLISEMDIVTAPGALIIWDGTDRFKRKLVPAKYFLELKSGRELVSIKATIHPVASL